jgi:hypothetical protein
MPVMRSMYSAELHHRAGLKMCLVYLAAPFGSHAAIALHPAGKRYQTL